MKYLISVLMFSMLSQYAFASTLSCNLKTTNFNAQTKLTSSKVQNVNGAFVERVFSGTINRRLMSAVAKYDDGNLSFTVTAVDNLITSARMEEASSMTTVDSSVYGNEQKYQPAQSNPVSLFLSSAKFKKDADGSQLTGAALNCEIQN